MVYQPFFSFNYEFFNNFLLLLLEILAMTKMHKSLATFLVGLSTSDLSESQIQLQIAEKNSNVLDLLKNISENQMITISELKSKKYQPSVENFLFNLALAENIMML